MRSAACLAAALSLGAVVAPLGHADSSGSENSIQWMTERDHSLELLLVREGLCGGILTLDSVRRIVRWAGAPGDIGCKDGFEAGFDDVRTIRAQSDTGFLIDFKKGAGKRLVVIPLPHAAWLSHQTRFRDASAKAAIDSASLSADGDGPSLPGASMLQRVEVPP